MDTTTTTDSKWDRLIRPEYVHGSLYTDEAIFREELEKIWYRTWVYVGHVSEIPNPNDYVLKTIGLEEVIMTRDREGQINLLHNRCPHRGNRVCVKREGNARSFTCAYHGWNFGNDGALKGYPYPSGYPDDKRKELGLGKVARMSIYKGFVFGSLAADGPTLEEHLGPARAALDNVCANSPEGEIELNTGFLQHKVKANWKLLVENETDGYHPQVTHASIFEVAQSGIGPLYNEAADSVTRYFGNGHSELDLRPEFRKFNEPMRWFGTSASRLPDYVSKMNARYGEQKAHEIMVDGVRHVMIFPNLFIAEIQLFVLQPLSVSETVQHVTALQFKGAPDLNRRMRQQTMGSVGPAGFLLADDAEMYERTQAGVAQRNPEWLYLGRGSHRERVEDDGCVIGNVTDDMPSRHLWKHYKSLMEAA
ncbi:MAG: aromatic ring-hydroxylating dioxygenase subunit alpha [Hydrogenophaga sp.]|uniref:Aromatic ring-hydroxylating dioxygenase subunit alpha n=1 Tax=Hydrogenophaga crocea TaxID=2716225 RepID=A0A6G8IL88_9BURK|nr:MULTISPECIES: aromatic ring-hydroxylating dioxygenase subunit alpha [Hydrogenophaga]MBL0943735.1 aromatic ring-hydroxylating dioxygenase subunit alpha [Hydrogenophaga sp.]QIM53775.1 aromatic ring-hydroxylating dioxygenase subunit alpha [Hydrogenophaga crocea]